MSNGNAAWAWPREDRCPLAGRGTRSVVRSPGDARRVNVSVASALALALPRPLPWLALAVVALAGALLALVVARLLRRWRGSWRARRRATRAVAGEGDAAVLLRRAGFRIVAIQPRTAWAPLIDGEPHAIELRADYLVEADGELLVAEVKTGDEAPRLTTAATRRQLLEYSIAFAVDGILLVCPERGAIHRIEFPEPRAPSLVREDRA